MLSARFPDGTDVFEVTPYNGKGQAIGRPVYVRATSKSNAESGARTWLRILGRKGKFHLRARVYNPLHDPEMRGFVRPA